MDGVSGVRVTSLSAAVLEVWPDKLKARATPRGQLRIYLGAAAGVGKTYALLDEGHRRGERAADVVVAFAETHGRPQTVALLDGLEINPARPRWLITEPGMGYRYQPHDQSVTDH
jgi:osmosensitive K+ channel His kinase sensor protein